MFWAAFLGSEVEADGQVPGFSRAWDKLSPWARAEADRYAYFAWVKIERDHRDADECIPSGVSALRDRLREEPPEATTLPGVEEIRALVSTIVRGLSDRPEDQHPRPVEIPARPFSPDETWEGWS
jgi:hypothetical protein